MAGGGFAVEAAKEIPRKGRVASFTAAIATMPIELDLSTSTLYGREKQLAELSAALEESPSVVWVEGDEGAGKTSLLEVWSSQLSMVGYGKMEETAHEPYGGILECLRSILSTVLQGPLAVQRQRELADELRILAPMIPDLQLTDYHRPSPDAFAQHWGAKRLIIAIRSILRMLSSTTTVVMILDDLQWVDEGSLTVLSAILADRANMQKLVVIGAHRPLPDDHSVRELYSDKDRHVAVGDLTLANVTDLLGGLLRRKGEDDIVPLAEVIHRKTSGHAFYVVQLLDRLQSKAILLFSGSTLTWTWDLERVVLETELSPNVLAMVDDKIKRLPDDVQEALSFAAFVGAPRFDVELLKRMGLTDTLPLTDLVSLLDIGAEQGLLEKSTSAGKYKFAHDCIKERVQLPAKSEARTALHWRVGQALRAVVAAESVCDDSLVLLSANHLNAAVRRMETVPDRVDIARINLQAAGVAFKRLSFTMAKVYLETGRLLLGKNAWNHQYSLALKLASNLAYARFCLGDLTGSQMVIDEVINKAQRLREKLPAYRTLALCLSHKYTPAAGVDVILDVLDLLGVHLPRKFVKFHVVRKIYLLKRKLATFTDTDLLHLPKAEPNETVDAVVDFFPLLVVLSHAGGDDAVRVLVMLEAAALTLRVGRTKISANAMSCIACLFAQMKDFESAHRYARIALKFAEPCESPICDARAITGTHVFSMHWRISYNACLEPLVKANNILKESPGDLFFSAFSYTAVYYECGLDLRPLELDLMRSIDLLTEYGQVSFLNILKPRAQMVHNLMGRSKDPLVMTGQIMDQQKCLQSWKMISHKRALNQLALCRMYLAYFFHDFELAGELSASQIPPSEVGPMPWLVSRFLFQGLIAFALARKSQRRRHVRAGMKYLRQIEAYFKAGNVNCHHMMLLLRAERRSLGHAEPKEDYDRAISAAGRVGVMHHQALANELAGSYFLRRKDSYSAEVYISRAIDLYRQWGALAKANHMENVFGSVVDVSSSSISVSGSHHNNNSTFRARPRIRPEASRHSLVGAPLRQSIMTALELD